MTDEHAPGSTPVTGKSIRYRRAKFSTRLYDDCLYTAAHAWLRREEGGLWQVGYTHFATRMLGDPVELDFESKEGDSVEKGQEVGWLEGFKAVSDIYSPLPGLFRGGNDALLTDIELLSRDPLQSGWLYRLEGEPDSDCLERSAYISVLDAAIDRILGNKAPS